MKTAFYLTIGFILVFIFSCGGNKELVMPPAVGNWQIHVVKKGETLYQIAQQYGTTTEELQRINRIKNPKKISAGRRLWVPAGPGEGKKGETPPEIEPGKEGKKGGPEDKKAIKSIIWPVRGPITTKFGFQSSKRHDGIDISAEKGTPILAAADGEVIFSGWGPGGYGQMIIIKHSKRMLTVYAHNENNLVEKGRKVKQGETIGKVGKSGNATGNHVHFEVRIDRKPKDPLKYLPK